MLHHVHNCVKQHNSTLFIRVFIRKHFKEYNCPLVSGHILESEFGKSRVTSPHCSDMFLLILRVMHHTPLMSEIASHLFGIFIFV